MTHEEWREGEIVRMATNMLEVYGPPPGNWPFKDTFAITCFCFRHEGQWRLGPSLPDEHPGKKWSERYLEIMNLVAGLPGPVIDMVYEDLQIILGK